MTEGEHNPYAPPAARGRDDGLGDPGPGGGPASEYASERRGVALCIGLTLLTLGHYPAIWLIKRRPFLDSLDSEKKLGGLPILVLVAAVLSTILAFAGKETASIRPLFQVASVATALIANFRVLSILRSDSARTGRWLEFSSVGTFFFGMYYLQYKINQLADVPARIAPRRKKKRKKRSDRADESTADANVPDGATTTADANVAGDAPADDGS